MKNSDDDARPMSTRIEQAARALAQMATCDSVSARKRSRFDWFSRRLTVGVLTQMVADRKRSIGSEDVDDGLNPYQRLLLDVYPGRDWLDFDPKDTDAAGIAVACDATGDSLFTFLWRNFEGRSLTDGGEDALTGLCMALHDIIEVTVAVIDAHRPADACPEEGQP